MEIDVETIFSCIGKKFRLTSKRQEENVTKISFISVGKEDKRSLNIYCASCYGQSNLNEENDGNVKTCTKVPIHSRKD